MWLPTFDGRLQSWNSLRSQTQKLDVPTALSTINKWWFQSPWKPYHLHWDDQEIWPDPWQLLSDNIYCDLARGLGILYTITLLERPDLASACLVLTEDGHNLVLVDKTKYILNWESDSVVNSNLELKVRRQYQQHQIK
jgi:hypothetical protein